MTNNGNEALNSLSLLEDLRSQYGGAFVRIVGVPTIQTSTASDDPEINAAYDGESGAPSELFDNTGSNTSLLDVDSSLTVRIVIEIDPDNATANIINGGLFNQATVSGTGDQSGTLVDDDSDDQTVATNNDNDADNDPDDPNEIRIPLISLQKQIVGSPQPASSTVPGNFDVTYSFTLENDGTTPLDSLTLLEDLETQFGGAFVRIVGTPSIISSTATTDPGINAAYDGRTGTHNIFDASPSLLNVNEQIVVRIVVEVDPNNTTADYDTISSDADSDLENQATTTGEDPVTNIQVTDNSDDPTDSTNVDDDSDNDPDDPTGLIIPDVTLTKSQVGTAVPSASGISATLTSPTTCSSPTPATTHCTRSRC